MGKALTCNGRLFGINSSLSKRISCQEFVILQRDAGKMPSVTSMLNNLAKKIDKPWAV
jgi:hypothetical protein